MSQKWEECSSLVFFLTSIDKKLCIYLSIYLFYRKRCFFLENLTLTILRYSELISHVPEGEHSKMAPFRILSFDIECAGRKGHFPEPNHDPVIQVVVCSSGIKNYWPPSFLLIILVIKALNCSLLHRLPTSLLYKEITSHLFVMS